MYSKSEIKNLREAMYKIFFAVNNQNRNKIIHILAKAKQEKKPLTISDIHKQMDISYKSVYQNIQVLNNADMVVLEKNPTASGQAVTVHLAEDKGGYIILKVD